VPFCQYCLQPTHYNFYWNLYYRGVCSDVSMEGTGCSFISSKETICQNFCRYCINQVNVLHSNDKMDVAECRGVPNPVAARSKAWVCGCWLAGIAGSIPAPGHGCLSCECCVLSGRSLCNGPITRVEESYRMWCV